MMKRYRHQFLTFRQMLFVNCLMWTFFNKSASARMAGYSVKSAKYQGYRLYHTLSVQLYLHWKQEQLQFMLNFPKAEILLPDDDELKRELAKYGVKVRWFDIVRATMNAPTSFNMKSMDKDNQHLATMLQRDIEQDENGFINAEPPKLPK